MKGSTNAIGSGSTVSFYLTVTVSCTGLSDLSGISVTATPTSSSYATASGTTNSSGVAVLNVSQGATYTVTASKSDCVFTATSNVVVTELSTACTVSGYKYGSVTVTVTDEKSSGTSVTVTAKSGSTTRTKTLTLSSTSQSVSFTDLAAGTWTFSTTYPSSATGADSKSVTVANGGSYNVTLAIAYTVVYGFRIAVSTSDCASRVTYPQTIFSQNNKAYGLTPASSSSDMGSWSSVTDELIAGIKRQTGNATSGWTDVSSKTAKTAGSSGGTDVMTYFPTWWMRINNDGTNIDVAFANVQIDSNWKDHAGSVGSNRIGHFRLGNFLAVNASSQAYSYGGTTPTGSVSLANWEAYCQARGTGYDMMTWYMYEYVVALLVLIYKSTNLQAFMRGYVDSHSSATTQSALDTNVLGMAGSSSDGRMAAFWIHDFYGHMYQWVGGAKTSSYKLVCQSGYCDNDGTFDITTNAGPSSTLSGGAIDKVTGTTDSGFFPLSISGSYTTYFADRGLVSSSSFGLVGGAWYDGAYVGPFTAGFNYSASYAHTSIGARLAYRL